MPERYQFFVTSLTCRLQSGGGVHQDEVGCRISKNAQSFNAFHDERSLWCSHQPDQIAGASGMCALVDG
jgi:hypothetical protein